MKDAKNPSDVRAINIRLKDENEYECLCKRLSVAEWIDRNFEAPARKPKNIPAQSSTKELSIEEMLNALKNKDNGK